MIAYFNHLVELRSRLIHSCLFLFLIFCGFFYFADILYEMVSNPILRLLPSEYKLIATEVTSTFTAPLKLSFIASILLSMPFFLYQIWAFVSPALYIKEKKNLLFLFVGSSLLFYIGISFGYFIICPLALKFFTSCAPSNVSIMTDINSYLTFILNILLAAGVAFQVPIITILTVKSGMLQLNQVTRIRKYVIVFAFVIGMILTPPDVVSQVLLAIPIWFLFELGILYCRLSD